VPLSLVTLTYVISSRGEHMLKSSRLYIGLWSNIQASPSAVTVTPDHQAVTKPASDSCLQQPLLWLAAHQYQKTRACTAAATVRPCYLLGELHIQLLLLLQPSFVFFLFNP
jgi:hypothetical protein